MNNTTEFPNCCSTQMCQQQPEIYWMPGDFPVFIDRVFVCASCDSFRAIEVNDPEQREQIAGHLLSAKTLAPVCCLQTTQEQQPEILLHSYPPEVWRVFGCRFCRQNHRFPVADPARRDEIASTLFSWEARS